MVETKLLEVPCFECGRDVLATTSVEGEERLEVEEGNLVVRDQTFSESTGLLAVCSQCLGRFSIRPYIKRAEFVPCLGKKGGRYCFKPIVVLVSIFGKRRAFGGRVDFTPIGRIPLYRLDTARCNACLKQGRPLARLKRLIQQIVSLVHEPAA